MQRQHGWDVLLGSGVCHSLFHSFIPLGLKSSLSVLRNIKSKHYDTELEAGLSSIQFCLFSFLSLQNGQAPPADLAVVQDQLRDVRLCAMIYCVST